MLPNLITLFRIVLVFVSISLFGRSFYLDVAAIILTIITLTLDYVDGLLARKLGLTTDVGAAFDIAGDRIVENVYWIYFAAIGMISFWIPIIVITRGFLIDFLRAVAFKKGKTAFGQKTMITTWWGKVLVGSRISRATYGILKCAAFCYLGMVITLRSTQAHFGISIGGDLLHSITVAGLWLIFAVVCLCIIRAVPVLWEGRQYLKSSLGQGV